MLPKNAPAESVAVEITDRCCAVTINIHRRVTRTWGVVVWHLRGVCVQQPASHSVQGHVMTGLAAA